MPHSPPGSSQSSTKRDVKKKKKSWSLEGKNKKNQPKSRQQIKAMLLAREKIKEEDLDAPPNSDAKDDSLRIFEQQRFMPEKEEYVRKPPQIAIKRTVKKKGHRRAETVRHVRKKNSRTETPKMNSGMEGSRENVDTSLFKERSREPSANNSNANSPDNSDRQREREARRRASEERTQERTQEDRSIIHQSPTGHQDSEGDSTPLPLAREPEPEIENRRSTVVQRSTVEKSASRVVKTKQEHHLMTAQQKEPTTVRPSQQRTTRSSMGMLPSPASKPSNDMSTQLALEPEPDLERVRRNKEAAFMKRFITALKLLPNTAPTRPAPLPAPRSEDSPSDSSKRQSRNFKHNMHHNMRKHPK